MRWLAKFTEHPEAAGETYRSIWARCGVWVSPNGSGCRIHGSLTATIFVQNYRKSRNCVFAQSDDSNRQRLIDHVVGGNSIVENLEFTRWK